MCKLIIVILFVIVLQCGGQNMVSKGKFKRAQQSGNSELANIDVIPDEKDDSSSEVENPADKPDLNDIPSVISDLANIAAGSKNSLYEKTRESSERPSLSTTTEAEGNTAQVNSTYEERVGSANTNGTIDWSGTYSRSASDRQSPMSEGVISSSNDDVYGAQANRELSGTKFSPTSDQDDVLAALKRAESLGRGGEESQPVQVNIEMDNSGGDVKNKDDQSGIGRNVADKYDTEVDIQFTGDQQQVKQAQFAPKSPGRKLASANSTSPESKTNAKSKGSQFLAKSKFIMGNAIARAGPIVSERIPAIAVDVDVVAVTGKGPGGIKIGPNKNAAVAVDIDVADENNGKGVVYVAQGGGNVGSGLYVKNGEMTASQIPLNSPFKGNVQSPVQYRMRTGQSKKVQSRQFENSPVATYDANKQKLEVEVDIVKADGGTGGGSQVVNNAAEGRSAGGNKKDAIEVDIDLARRKSSNGEGEEKVDVELVPGSSVPRGRMGSEIGGPPIQNKKPAIEVSVDLVSKDGKNIPAHFVPEEKTVIMKDQVAVKPGSNSGQSAIQVDFDVASNNAVAVGLGRSGNKSTSTSRIEGGIVSSSRPTSKTRRPLISSLKTNTFMKFPRSTSTRRWSKQPTRRKTIRNFVRVSPTQMSTESILNDLPALTTHEIIVQEPQSDTTPVDLDSNTISDVNQGTTKKRGKNFKYRARIGPLTPEIHGRVKANEGDQKGGVAYWVWGSVVAVVALSMVVVGALSFSPIRRFRREGTAKPESA